MSCGEKSPARHDSRALTVGDFAILCYVILNRGAPSLPKQFMFISNGETSYVVLLYFLGGKKSPKSKVKKIIGMDKH